MKTTTYFCSLIACILLLAGCGLNTLSPGKNKITKKYSVQSFNTIESNAAGEIIFTQSNITRVEATGPDNYVSHVFVSSKDNVLSLFTDSKDLQSDLITIHISCPQLISISHRGVGSLILKDTIKTDTLTIQSHGVGNLIAKNFEGNYIDINSTGVGNIIVGGKTNSAHYYSKGVGNLSAHKMIATDIVVEQEGIGNVSCYGSGIIDITNKGIGNVDYYGNETVNRLKKSGIGSVNHN